MKITKMAIFSTSSRDGDFRAEWTYEAEHLYNLIAGQNMDLHRKVSDIKLVRRQLGYGLRDSLIFCEDAYNSNEVTG